MAIIQKRNNRSSLPSATFFEASSPRNSEKIIICMHAYLGPDSHLDDVHANNFGDATQQLFAQVENAHQQTVPARLNHLNEWMEN